MQAVHRTAEVAINARSEVRSPTAYRTAFDLARHYRDEVVPLRKRISDENLLRYNGMLSSVFELLADARDQVMTVTAAIEAQRDYWIAETNLQTALTGRSPGGSAARPCQERRRRARRPLKDPDATNRRTFFRAAGATFLGAAAVSRTGARPRPEAVIQTAANTQVPPSPPNGRPFNPLVTLNGWSLPWRMKDGVKEFHLVAEPVVREIAPA